MHRWNWTGARVALVVISVIAPATVRAQTPDATKAAKSTDCDFCCNGFDCFCSVSAATCPNTPTGTCAQMSTCQGVCKKGKCPSKVPSLGAEEGSSSRLSVWKPSLTLVKDGKDTYTLYSVTLTPNSCFKAAGMKEGMPEGQVAIAAARPVQLLFSQQKPPCLMALLPVAHVMKGLKLNEAMTSVAAFAVLDGAVKGSDSVSKDQAQEPPKMIPPIFLAK